MFPAMLLHIAVRLLCRGNFSFQLALTQSSDPASTSQVVNSAGELSLAARAATRQRRGTARVASIA
eukprot:4724580-Pyramimonas_sp.AAC.1